MQISNSLLEREEASIDVVKKYIVLDYTVICFSPFCATSEYILAFIHAAGYAYLSGSVTHAYKDIPCNSDHQVTGKPQCKRFNWFSNEVAELDNVCAHDIAFWQFFERRPIPKSSSEPPDSIEHHGQSQRKRDILP